LSLGLHNVAVAAPQKRQKNIIKPILFTQISAAVAESQRCGDGGDAATSEAKLQRDAVLANKTNLRCLRFLFVFAL